ncbi:facilitated trehalose transporter Tret1-like [Macrosteles quadrilineatus]|uniref:facilitated trehalose transporter Tret1-like n=1 Tax=Macrosteles quadrilineatus TaxID=74068 RepID=UPI0023E1C9E1|nr:facilitated trehalose transporter Tret1-like [Macrosteles quadrilineatus]
MAVKRIVSKGLLNQYIAAISACMSVVASGSCYGWITPILTDLLSPGSEIDITPTQMSWVVSIIELGNFLSPLPAGIVSDKIGRKPVILATGPVYILGWIIILYFPTPLMLGIARTIHGLGMGLAFTAAPIYLGEIAGDKTRGVITSLFFNSWWVGFLISYSVGPFISYRAFTWFTLAVNIPFIVIFAFQPETPYYYMMKGNVEKAMSTLMWFRDKSEDEIDKEMAQMKISVEENQKKASVKDIVATPIDRKAFCMLLVLTCVRITSGTGAVLVYATQIFDMVPHLTISSDVITIVFGVVMLIGGIVGSVTTDTLGRRPLLLISCIGSLICQAFTGTYFFLLFKTSVVVSNFSWIAPVSILIYSGLCTAGMYPVCSAYTSELFSSNMRGLASSFGSVNVTFFSWVSLALYLPFTQYIGLYANFYFYSIVLLFGSVYFYLFAPETKGKSFVQIRREMSQKSLSHLDDGV